MNMEQTLRLALQAIKGLKLPELPEELILIEQELASRFCSSHRIAAIIEQNTTLSGEVLRLANSPVYKLRNPAETIGQAVLMLGMDNIKNLVFSASMKDLFNSSELYKDIMSHSVDVAVCMADLSEWVADITRDEAYMMGLFHNAGCLMLATKDPENYAKVFQLSHSSPSEYIKREQLKYNTSHTAIGVLLGKKWHLPIDILSAIYLHHISECGKIENDRVRALVALTKIANSIVSEISLGAYRGEEMKNYERDGKNELMIPDGAIREIRIALMGYSNRIS
ncbi:HDOD domain-containing protein [Thiomicrospira microaerophila]|uniref:HDOD domain-containing protein n=1 Tax=Thiomicrospira microaerophila TaxID=406020 RepID=UPI00200D8809|nr:HDOD domain-containing protein [Thiomicrospira microaerophila]UQB42676.1 HDOD domain-containing protein [Thiomicrospira microaerophila]